MGAALALESTEVTVVLSGMNEYRQVEENARVASDDKASELSEKHLALLEQVKDEITRRLKVNCTGCSTVCLARPGLDISAVFEV